jgi:WD40 repeat protein
MMQYKFISGGQYLRRQLIACLVIIAILLAGLTTIVHAEPKHDVALFQARIAEASGNREEAARIILELAAEGVYDEALMRDIVFGVGQEKRLTGHTDDVKAVAISPDGRYAASAAGDPGTATPVDTSVIIWDLHQHELVQRCTGHTDGVMAVAFSPDGSQVASGSQDGTIRLWEWDANECRTVQVLPEDNQFGHASGSGGSTYIWDIAYMPDGTGLISASNDGTMILWDLATSRAIHHYVGTARPWVNTLAISPDGRFIVSGADASTYDNTDATLVMVHPVSGNSFTIEPKQSLIGHSDHVISIAINPVDTSLVLTASRDGTVRYWDLDTGELVLSSSGTASSYSINDTANDFQSVAISPDGTTAVFGTGTFYSNGPANEVLLWDLANWQVIHKFTGHTGGIWDVMFTPDGTQAVSASGDSSLIIWNLVDTAVISEASTWSVEDLLVTIKQRFGDDSSQH